MYILAMSEASSPFGKRPTQIAATLLAELGATADAIATSDAASAGPKWGAMHKALLKAKVDPQVIMRLVAARDVAGLALLLRWLRGEEIAVEAKPEPVVVEVDIEVQRSAMRAFRKRLRFARLDAESRLGVGPMSSGKRNEIDAIIPPREFGVEVWEALAAAGRLRREGGGFYALVHDDVGDE
jgi:hypothetical protein